MTRLKLGFATILLTIVPGLAFAGPGVYIEGGTLGVGAGVAFRLSDNLSVRLGYSGLNYSPSDFQVSGITYDAKVDYSNGKALLDWHPFGGGFRFSLGIFYNDNKVSVEAKPQGGVYTINNVDYQASDIGKLAGKVDFNTTSPYLGIGWGNVVGRNGHFHVLFDLGVLYQGSPNVSLNATCTPALSAADCATLRSNVAVEEKDLSDKANDYKYYPVANLAVSYRF